MSEHSKFHRGERVIQERAGETAQADRNISALTDTVIDRARTFIGKQSMAVVASVNADGGVCASVLFGQPGFAHTDTGKSIVLAMPAEERDETDAFWANVGLNPSIGMLFIELGSRRRYRVNGNLASIDAAGIEVGVVEAYPNCPKYIQRRNLRAVGRRGTSNASAQGSLIEGKIIGIVRHADTLFVGSYHPELGADVSHRGGAPGFITILNETTLRIPDYPGNCLFNTFGNFEVNPRAGLCIPDFPGNRLLQLSGEVVLHWDMPDPEGQTGGTLRFWDFKIDRYVVRDTPQQLEWEYLDPSSFNMPVAVG
jgi:predicted pyridoxine 5'-phosphate oxidase superfamily flavin-nucleotide-binding protein